MALMSAEDLLRQMQWRYAVKRFDPARKIPDGQWNALEEALILSPSSYGLQPWRFIVVADPKTREALVPASWNQKQPVEASHFVAFAIRKNLGTADVDRLISRIAEVRGVTAASLDSYRNMMLGTLEQAAKGVFNVDDWCARQLYIALGTFMASAAVMGIDTCPMEGIEPAKYDEILGLKGTGYGVVVACAAGYRAAEDKHASSPKVRFPREEIITRR